MGSSISYKQRRQIILLAIFCPIILLATFALIVKCSALCVDYATSLSMLVHGVLGLTTNDSGIIYLNSTTMGIHTAFDYENLEFYSGDNFSKLSNVVYMFAFASKNDMIGDMIFLYNYVAYNGYHEPMSMTMDSEFAGDVLEYMQTGVINVDYTYIINKTTDATLASFYTDLSKSGMRVLVPIVEWKRSYNDDSEVVLSIRVLRVIEKKRVTHMIIRLLSWTGAHKYESYINRRVCYRGSGEGCWRYDIGKVWANQQSASSSNLRSSDNYRLSYRQTLEARRYDLVNSVIIIKIPLARGFPGTTSITNDVRPSRVTIT
ncbi:hypothetical protein POJ06DRAFT_241598 [Lipomyces tetrasporus]|uniref:WD-like domain-containing protein n=1 Tax=Lipomyces tetrasporus TaxID=54092 RepID=A0AAD7VPY0_9ASCO|nr:uncharacterized protein POJ06DRAFT_241598 [Lipomyces tetrasporus]KAJ8096580.1 hypothetical protein POJ06DRAFT_241598 [Lipomyces tetrasporus]